MIVKSPPEKSSSSMSLEHSENDLQYRSISKAAILSIVFAILGGLSFFGTVFLILPILGIGFGIAGIFNVKAYPLEMVGKNAAIVGIIMSLLCFSGAAAAHAYVYYTEVPEGYQRISFYDLKPNKLTQLPYSEAAKQLDGKKVFVRGYVRANDKERDLSSFILVGDFGDCCFGGNPKITDVIGVSIKIDETVDYSWRVRKIGGTFRLHDQVKANADDEVPGIVYEIEADHVR